MIESYATDRIPEANRETDAQALCAEIVERVWDQRTDKDRSWLRPWKGDKSSLSLPSRRLARQAADVLARFSEIEAAYLVGTLYTALLPVELRAERGAFYTPPALAERLIDLAAAEGVDFATARMLDPACGGGAFLTPLAHRLLNDYRLQRLDAEQRLIHLETHLAGIEIDPFAAWLSRTFLQLLTYTLSLEAGRALEAPVLAADALEQVAGDRCRYDLVIGNPPYGRVRLAPDKRNLFARSLYGHANIYGVFLDAALRWRAQTGLIAFLTPTSFLGGQYFSRLRDLLLQEAPPLIVDVVDARKGVFDSVLQETCLTIFGPNPSKTTVLHLLQVNGRSMRAHRAGTYTLPQGAGSPWLLPRTPQQAKWMGRAAELTTRLHHLGYKASTGPLVWNRHKSQLRSRPSNLTFPLIWAEAVRPNEFNFKYRARATTPFLAVEKNQKHLVSREPSVLVQRTTAKEQERRLIACSIPEEFLKEWGGVVVENHVNILRSVDPKAVHPAVLAAILNTEAVDQLFRCVSGSVAVSSTELHALPLPDKDVCRKVAEILRKESEPGARQERVERIVARAYGV